MTYQEYKEIKIVLDKRVAASSNKLNSFLKMADGRVSDEIKASEGYVRAKKEFARHFMALRDFNKNADKKYHREYQREARQKLFNQNSGS